MPGASDDGRARVCAQGKYKWGIKCCSSLITHLARENKFMQDPLGPLYDWPDPTFVVRTYVQVCALHRVIEKSISTK